MLMFHIHSLKFGGGYDVPDVAYTPLSTIPMSFVVDSSHMAGPMSLHQGGPVHT
ncbi:hypothetical protein [Lysinibacillus sp. JK80]|uniref:hypothetical protein n=1 Tax=Lysinibacillus sp. JK80 TaxID=2749809 RepID=UPI002FD39AF4